MAALHAACGWVVVVSNGLVGLWALGASQIEALRVRALWFAIGIAEVVIGVQVFLGVAALDGRDTEPYEFHMFYGFVALLAVGLIYSYRTHLRAHIHLFYGLGSLFLMGLGLRAMTLGPTGGL